MAAMGAGAGAGAGGGGGVRSRDMRLTMQEAAKKLSLWNSATFRPILTHDELEPILAAAGFVALPPQASPVDQEQSGSAPVGWREYAFLGVSSTGGNAVAGWQGPRPRLPYPRIDALHLRTYQAFLGATELYLGALRVANLFHVRCMPVTAAHDRVFDKVFKMMRNHGVDDEGIIVYRNGTLDDATSAACSGHTPVRDAVGHHIIPGNTCSELGYLRAGRISGNCACDEESCTGVYPPGNVVVHLSDISPNPAPGRKKQGPADLQTFQTVFLASSMTSLLLLTTPRKASLDSSMA
ncbi:hypothetical protein GUJ93_ZPchr0008g14087 [Zizania palustris]|uniref:Uncharacterized protein n=1 Tax=Zizania palustris TaxID=103762 RepID=A0A8J5RLS8_ZIZPA|nr:hypothetical protein GUJ93_ZPchr0008g14087 [Zizania palustris]